MEDVWQRVQKRKLEFQGQRGPDQLAAFRAEQDRLDKLEVDKAAKLLLEADAAQQAARDLVAKRVEARKLAEAGVPGPVPGPAPTVPGPAPAVPGPELTDPRHSTRETHVLRA